MTENSPQYDRLRFVCLHLIPEHGQVHIQPLIDISGEELLHGRKVMLHMVFIESTVVGQTIRELNVDRRIACFHQFQIHRQTAGATVAVNERMDMYLDMLQDSHK